MGRAEKLDLTSSTHNYHARYPAMSTGPVPVEPYVSEAYFEREREAIFRQMWLLAGRLEKLAQPGDYYVRPFEVLNTSLIVVRGTDNRVRAFHNVCRHRGTPLAAGAGNCKFFTCRFHGWVYDTQGKIRHVADAGQFVDLDKSKLNLDEVHCKVWKGFVFVNFASNPRETLAEQLAETGEQLTDFPFEGMVVAGHWGATLKANWKLFLDAFQEGYHVATVHSGTINTYYTGRKNPYCRPSSVRLYKRNRALTIPFNPECALHPSEQFAVKMGEALSQGEAGLAKGFPGVNPEQDDNFSFDINGVFPNVLIDTSIGFFFIHEFWPIDANTTRWEATMHFPPPTSAGSLIGVTQSVALLRDAFREDIATSEGSQAGMRSGSLKGNTLFRSRNYLPSSIGCGRAHGQRQMVSGLSSIHSTHRLRGRGL